jgi:hypothetical protein
MRRTPEIVQTHGFAKFPKGTRISDVIDAASGEGTPFVGGPKTLMMAATNDDPFRVTNRSPFTSALRR